MEWSNEVLEQYSRQMLVDEIGFEGQARLFETAVVLRGPEPWRGWASRYLRASGAQVEEVEADRLSLEEADGRIIEIDLGDGRGASLRHLGLALAGWLYEHVSST
ncbi:hypothetical protein [Sulfobacillus harzensis]|uniref:Uncharacterized protein n=1 Tax=Sulfobacillus harzensis TaxID=2729629 RepID=A0A7Y0L3F0_9FIRM|nr:hypothetical protein [Sulfobacillus harzensis]NMP22363.1 hypothetical protein [Sulfobacillus harzensis]